MFRNETCPKCGSDVYCCLNCTNYDEAAHNQCREPQAEKVSVKDRGISASISRCVRDQGHPRLRIRRPRLDASWKRCSRNKVRAANRGRTERPAVAWMGARHGLCTRKSTHSQAIRLLPELRQQPASQFPFSRPPEFFPRGFSPQALQVVELAHRFLKDMDNDVPVIQQGPVSLLDSFVGKRRGMPRSSASWTMASAIALTCFPEPAERMRK